ncbi:MAG: hypothetical protein R3B72_11605 [Polyangiaceae bacterium]
MSNGDQVILMTYAHHASGHAAGYGPAAAPLPTPEQSRVNALVLHLHEQRGAIEMHAPASDLVAALTIQKRLNRAEGLRAKGGCAFALLGPVAMIGLGAATYKLGLRDYFTILAGCCLIAGIAAFFLFSSRRRLADQRGELVQDLLAVFPSDAQIGFRVDSKQTLLHKEGNESTGAGGWRWYEDPWLQLRAQLGPQLMLTFRRNVTRKEHVSTTYGYKKRTVHTRTWYLIRDELECHYPPGSLPRLVAWGQAIAENAPPPAPSSQVETHNEDGRLRIVVSHRHDELQGPKDAQVTPLAILSWPFERAMSLLSAASSADLRRELGSLRLEGNAGRAS